MLGKNLKSGSHADHAISVTASHETLNQIQGDRLFLISKLFLFIIIALILPSCAVRSVYVPTSQNVVLFDDKKQIQANAYVGSNHLELQLAHNPVNHLVTGLHVNYGTGLSSYEGMIGLYGYSQNNNWRAEFAGGAGYNSNFFQQNNSWMAAVKNEKINYETYSIYSKYFAQPSVGYFSKIEMYKLSYSFAFSCRASYLDFKKYMYKEISRDSITANSANPYLVNRDYKNVGVFILEPCFVNKIGLKNVWAVIQGQFIVPMNSDIDLHYANFSPVFLMSFGLQYNFVFKKQKVKKP